MSYPALSERLGQLSSLLCVAFSDDFHNFSLQVKANYLWLAFNLTNECIELIQNDNNLQENQEFIDLYQQLTPKQQAKIRNKITASLAAKQVQS